MNKIKIGVVGLGYVGLPLASLFSTKYSVIGYDLSKKRITEIMKGYDSTNEIDSDTLKSILVSKNSNLNGLFCSENLNDISDCNFYIITVPTPVDKNKNPVLSPLIKASESVASVLKKGDIVIYESTVYPGATEEDCVPILVKKSGLKFNSDFFVGYSPERINPGDKKHTVDKIMKVTSGSTIESALKIDELYKSIITAGTHLAPNIKVAEAAKVIENSQRDINIAFVNELSKIFSLMNINTKDVLSAAKTKWNFLDFSPGLVGGHCIGVDPYYLAKKSQKIGYNPEIILAGRRMNDSMGDFIASEIIKLMIDKNITLKNAEILVLGLTFKENCPDIRNTKVVDLINSLKKHELKITIYDPHADEFEVNNEYGLKLTKILADKRFDSIILAVAHNEFLKLDFNKLKKKNSVVYDVKNFLNRKIIDKSL